jgi:hypothetical protein
MMLFLMTGGISFYEAFNFYGFNSSVSLMFFIISVVALGIASALLGSVEKDATIKGAEEAAEAMKQFYEYKEREE